MKKILIFGDSITYGAWDKEGGWVQRLRKFLDEKYEDLLVYNLGISGNTTEDLIKRFKNETKQRLNKKENNETIIIFSIGINGSQFIYNKNKNKISLEKFKNNLQRLITLSKKFSSIIIFTGLTPVDETITTPIPWNTNKSYRNEFIKKYDQIIKNICKENKVYFAETFRKLKKMNPKNIVEDGLHPNSEGHQKIFEIVKNLLIKEKII